MTDQQLLEQFARDRSDTAFAELVRRHADWVHSMARRVLGGDDSSADDVAQAVFLVLCQKADKLTRCASLERWLFRVTRYSALHVLRAQKRRRQREQRAAIHHDAMDRSTDAARWAALVQILDQAVARLPCQDQQAVLLRFYQRQSMAQVGAGLGVTEDTAKKRVARALQRLRAHFARAGNTVPVDMLDTLLLANVTKSSLANLARLATAPTEKISTLAHGAIHMMFIARIKVFAALCLLVILPVGALVALPVIFAGKTSAAPVSAATMTSDEPPYVQAINLANALKPAPTPATIKPEFFQAHDAIFQLVHAGAVGKDQSWGGDDPNSAKVLRQLTGVRQLCALEALRFHQRTADGDFAGAQDDFIDALSLSRNIQRDPPPTLIVSLVQVAVEESVLSHFAQILPTIPASQLPELPDRLAKLPAERPFGDVVRAEQKATASRPNFTPAMLQQMNQLYDVMAKDLDQSPLPSIEQYNTDIDTTIAAITDPTAQMLAKILAPSIGRVCGTFSVYQSQWAMFQTAIAILRDGPDAVNKSVDPYGSGPFIYTKTADGFDLTGNLQTNGKQVTLHFGD